MAIGFQIFFTTIIIFNIKPSCLKKNGVELLVLDPGHDDSPVSRRSDDKVRAESGLKFLWPKIHEGQLNSAVAWLAFETILLDPSLSEEERDELRSMIRFSRYPGEASFGEFEKSQGYYSMTQGKIDSGVGNRQSRVNTMMRSHRKFQSSAKPKWSSNFSNIQDREELLNTTISFMNLI